MSQIDLRRFDLNLLVVLDVLMSERGVSRAAARLGRTQSAVSHSLARLREQLGDPLLHLLHRRPRDAVVAGGGEDDQRRGEEGDQGQQRVDRDHHDRHQGDRQQVLGDEDQAVAEEESDNLEIDGRARHQLTGLLVVEEADLEVLEVFVGARSQVVLDAERNLATEDAPTDRSSSAKQPDANHGEGDLLVYAYGTPPEDEHAEILDSAV